MLGTWLAISILLINYLKLMPFNTCDVMFIHASIQLMLPSRPGPRANLGQMGNNSLVSLNVHFYRFIETRILNVTGV